MPEEVVIKVEENPPNPPPNPPPQPVSVSSVEPQAEAAAAALVQTGAAAERAEQAAAEATQAKAEALTLAEQLKASLMPELQKISERLAALEALEEAELEELELQEPGNESISDSQENAQVVSLPEPHAAEPKSQEKPEEKRAVGLFHRVFLNK